MSDHAGDRARCWKCGAKVDLKEDWRGRQVALDPKPSALRRPTFVEVEMGEFVEVHRHECEPKPPAQPYDGRDVRPKKEPKRAPMPEPAPDLFVDSVVRPPMSTPQGARTADVAA
jgi:hypothetical protein